MMNKIVVNPKIPAYSETLLEYKEAKLQRALEKSFIERALSQAEHKESHIVFAFDPVDNPYKRLGEKSKKRSAIRLQIYSLLSELQEFVAGVKLGLPAIFALGPDDIEAVIDSFKQDYFFICDSKMADIGYVNKLVAEQVFGLGFDALIIHAFIGLKNGIDKVVKLAEEMDKGILVVCAMTHSGASEYLNVHFDEFLALAASAGVDGFILPATLPELIARTKEAYPRAIVFSPGVGTQGAPFGSAVAAGADFEIVGRAIVEASSPAQKAREIKEVIEGESRYR
jgi:orotidine-5'-phosphate decarboxylase